jgi:hypothetical protein
LKGAVTAINIPCLMHYKVKTMELEKTLLSDFQNELEALEVFSFNAVTFLVCLIW